MEAFATACIGCDEPHTHGLALLDATKISTSSDYATWRCQGVTHTLLTQQVLPFRPPGTKVPASDLRYWPRTQALLKQLTITIPNAKWYLKLDTDSARAAAPRPPPHDGLCLDAHIYVAPRERGRARALLGSPLDRLPLPSFH